MEKIFFTYPGNEQISNDVCTICSGIKGEFQFHKFPDGETYIRIITDVKEKVCVIICSLHHPDDKILPLYYLCCLCKDLGARQVVLVAPYLAYMRQDKQFNPGEAVTSEYFASYISRFADKLVTVDPHLHRKHSLSELYSIPCEVIHAAPEISKWIKSNIRNPVLIGPDMESEQWVSAVAAKAGAAFTVLHKTRLGDREVEVSIPDIDKFSDHTPVLVDDIISTARTMVATVKQIKQLKLKPPVCIGVHAVFAGNAWEELKNSGVDKVVTSNTIAHSSNIINMARLIADVI